MLKVDSDDYTHTAPPRHVWVVDGCTGREEEEKGNSEVIEHVCCASVEQVFPRVVVLSKHEHHKQQPNGSSKKQRQLRIGEGPRHRGTLSRMPVASFCYLLHVNR